MDKQNGEQTPQSPEESPPTPEKPKPDKISVECKHCETQNQFEVEKNVSDFTFQCAGCGSEITWER